MNKNYIKDKTMDISYALDEVTKYHHGKNNTCKFIVLHNTGDNLTLGEETAWLSKGGKASAQYIVDPYADIARIGMDNYILWHAGRGDLIKGYKDIMNWHSIGIEVISKGIVYTEVQVKKTYKLVKELQKKHGISNENVIRHKDYTTRKIDITDNFYKIVGCSSFEEWKEGKWIQGDVTSLRMEINALNSVIKGKDGRIKECEFFLAKNRKKVADVKEIVEA